MQIVQQLGFETWGCAGLEAQPHGRMTLIVLQFDVLRR
jgi:hypothetical protein